jgi:hypothetical protein
VKPFRFSIGQTDAVRCNPEKQANPRSNRISFDSLLKLSLFPLTLLVTLINTRMTPGNGVGLPCIFKGLCGFECYGCGISRAIMALWQGKLSDSYSYNKLGVLVFIVIACLSLREMVLLTTQRENPNG